MMIRILVFISGPLDIDAAEQYIRLKSPIDVREEGRIEIIKSPKCQKGKLPSGVFNVCSFNNYLHQIFACRTEC